MASTAVVGTGGNLGARIAERLQARGVELRCPDPRTKSVLPDLAEATAVVNVGGPRVRPGLGWSDYFREHVGVTAAVLRSMRPGARLIHVSSTAVYGARGDVLGATSSEAPTLFPSAAYACAKLAAESAARALGAERSIDVVVLRPSMVYGPGVDSALETLRRLHRRGVQLRLAPASVRQHLLHIDTLLTVIDRARTQRVVHDATPLLVADPFVLTNGDLAAVDGKGLPLTVDVRAAAQGHAGVARVLGASPGALEALAVLGMDNAFDVAPTWRALGLDPRRFDREATFDVYWQGR
jgi:nucleoside-diphosphate-sugar epimerase